MNDELHATYQGKTIAQFPCWCGNIFYRSQIQADYCTHTFEELDEEEKLRRINNTFGN